MTRVSRRVLLDFGRGSGYNRMEKMMERIRQQGMITEKMAQNWQTYQKYDVVVVGAGPSGFGAAIAAARRGLRVCLIENYGFAGGTATKSCTPLYFGFGVGGKQTTGGLSDEFVRRMDAVGSASLLLNDGCEMPEFRPIAGRELNAKVQMHPETMKLVMRRMLEGAGVTLLFYTRVCEAVVDESGRRITALLVSMFQGATLVAADRFVDCTGDALVCALANPDSIQKYTDEFNMNKSMFFFVGGVTPFDDESNGALYKQLYEAGRVPGEVWDHFGYSIQLNPGVCQIAVCYTTGDGVDSADMTRMDGALRENVFAVLDFLRREMPGFADCYLLDTALQVGVRGGQGIIGERSVTQDTVFGEDTSDCVAVTNRSCGFHSNKKGMPRPSWAKKAPGTGSVPMGALVPQAFDNVLCAGRAISADPACLNAFRMMNTCMTTGEAAGLMCVLAAQRGIAFQKVRYSDLLPLLRENRFILPT